LPPHRYLDPKVTGTTLRYTFSRAIGTKGEMEKEVIASADLLTLFAAKAEAPPPMRTSYS